MKRTSTPQKKKRKTIGGMKKPSTVVNEKAKEPAKSEPAPHGLKDIEPGKQDYGLINKLQDLVDRPLPAISDLKAQARERYFKCLLRSKAWFQMDEYHMHSMGIEYVDKFIGNATFVDVKFHVRRLSGSGGCGAVATDEFKTRKIGFASGKLMIGGVIHADSKQHFVRYNRKLQRFEVDGKEIVGAEAIILTKQCKALVINPTYANE